MITIEQFARVRASIEEGDDVSPVLRAEGVTPRQWRAAERRWLAVLVQEAERGDKTYRGVFEAALHDAAPRLSGDVSPEGTIPAPGRPDVPAAFVAPVALPRVVSPVVVSPGLNDGLVARASTSTVQTMAARDAPAATATPFVTTAQPVAMRPAADDVAQEARDMIGETETVRALTDEELFEGLPFESGTDEQPGLMDETAFITDLNIDNDAVVPFSGGSVVASDAPTRAVIPFANTAQPVAMALAAADVAHEAKDMIGETATVSALTDDELFGGLPFDSSTTKQPGVMDGTGELTTEQYAALSVELESASREQLLHVLHKYGIADEQALGAVRMAWNARIREDPQLFGRFRAAYDVYSDWIRLEIE